MPRTHSKLLGILSIIVLLCVFSVTNAQEKTIEETSLITYIQQLEDKFEIKFSFADADIGSVKITIPESEVLAEILNHLRIQTKLKIQKLNERYYTIVNTNTISICGVVLDNFQQNTVAGATVEILETDRAIITDGLGNFSLENVPLNAKIQIKHIGFKTLFIDAKELVNTDPCQTLLLSQFYQKLEEVVVYEFLTKGLVQQLDGSIQMNTDEFGILPGLIEPDVLQTIQALPGIKSIDETVSDINIRGGSNDQNLILWDGIKMYQSGHFFGLISAFNPFLTDEVTLIKNGTSAQYGDGVSGIIDMRTNNELTENYYGGGGFNLISGDLYGQVPLGKKVAFQFSGRRSLTDFFTTTTFDNLFTKAFLNDQIKDGLAQAVDVERDDKFYFYDFTGKVLYDINEKQKLRFSFININNFLDYSENIPSLNRETISGLDQTNYSLGGSLESKWSKKFSTVLNTYYSNYNLDANSATGQQSLLQRNKVAEKAFKLNSNFQLKNNLNWLNGYQLTETSITNETLVTQPQFGSKVKDLIKVHSLFSELSYTSPNKKLNTRGGIRLNYFDNPDSLSVVTVEPRLNINYAITKELKVNILGEFKSQGVNQKLDLEQNFLGIEKRRWVLSDGESLPVTKSKQISLGINYDAKNLYVGLEGFYKEVNGINTITQGFQNQSQFGSEIGKYDIKGIEFLINKKTSKYSVWASYAYNFNNYTFESIPPPTTFPNNLDIRHTATFAGTLTFNKLKIGVGLNYRTGKPFTEPDPDNPIDTTFFPGLINYQETNSQRLAEYLRADASVIYNFDIKSGIKASTGISVLNFTNRENILNTYYQVNDTNTIETVESFSLGITPNFSFRVKF
ncbi:TonB-dependent receptor [Maribacter algarum]|uniref:TonB-dependent receptor n=1 Tax=Maribacter algarum (ex Zhang et al. 2020) TaxID=2578118 RepID=A0A5S3PSW0_9FLAO|nr:carboxypeptidase-like regulatory domain-containing protein [Maribacter algarum]TMM58079.1 TonB-dependent receptor [Maribacter algarum]